MNRNQKLRTVSVIERDIQRLQKERDEAFAIEKRGVIARLKESIAHYGLTAVDLGLGAGGGENPKPVVAVSYAPQNKDRPLRVAAKPKTQPRKRNPRASMPKYADGNGHIWTGVGKRPRWFLEALAAGVSEESLRVQPTSSASPSFSPATVPEHVHLPMPMKTSSPESAQMA